MRTAYCATGRRARQDVLVGRRFILVGENHDNLTPADDPIARNELSPPAGLDDAVDGDLTRLNHQLRLAARGDTLGEFEKLVKPYGVGHGGVGGVERGVRSWIVDGDPSLPFDVP